MSLRFAASKFDLFCSQFCSGETWLWHGWALYRQGNTLKAIENWHKALAIHPGHQDTLYALNFAGTMP